MREKRVTKKSEVVKVEKKEAYQYDNNIVGNIVLKGDISGLDSAGIVRYYNDFCHTLGLNPVTKPFDVIEFKGKKVLYANRNCAEQLRAIRGVSIYDIRTENVNGLYIVKAYAQDKTGRQDVGTAAIDIKNLNGEALANAIMKCETKAKRRVSLSLCAIGLMDESELDTIGEYKKVEMPKDVTPKKSENHELEKCLMDKLSKILTTLEKEKYHLTDAEAKAVSELYFDFDQVNVDTGRIEKAIEYFTKKLGA